MADLERVTAAVAARVRAARSEHGWTLDELAARAGVSRRTLVQIERAATNPSIETLLRLSDALGVGLPDLVDPAPDHDVVVTRAADVPTVWRGDAGGRARLRAGIGAPDVVELWDWTLGPREVHRSDGHRPGTRELLFVLEGRLEVAVDGRHHVLDPGDAASYPGDRAHHYREAAGASARFALTVVEPGVGT